MWWKKEVEVTASYRNSNIIGIRINNCGENISVIWLWVYGDVDFDLRKRNWNVIREFVLREELDFGDLNDITCLT